MNMFPLNEQEYNALDSIRGQLALVSDLLSATGANSSIFTAEDLMLFMAKQAESLRSVIRAVDARYDTMLEHGQLGWVHWTHALKIASGDAIHTPNGAEQYVLDGLTKASRIDEDMGSVIALWLEILDKQKPAPAPTATAKKPAPRKRDKLAEAMPPAGASAPEGKSPTAFNTEGAGVMKPKPKTAITPQEAIEIGTELMKLKALALHGEFQPRLDQLGYGEQEASRFMEAARKFHGNRFAQLLEAVDTVSKLNELMLLDDEDIATLDGGGEVFKMTLDSIKFMTVKEIRAAIREGSSLSEQLSSSKLEKIQQLSSRTDVA